FLKSWILAHYAERVLACWKAEYSAVRKIEINVRSAVLRSLTSKPKPERLAEQPVREPRENAGERMAVRSPTSPAAIAHEALGGAPLDPRLSFESFVVGRSNMLAHAAARQVATGAPGDPVMFNPLYAHAMVGLGKTHLLQAIAWAGNGNGRKVLYL